MKARQGKFAYFDIGRGLCSAAHTYRAHLNASDLCSARGQRGTIESVHQDPFDRMIGAQCLEAHLPCVTKKVLSRPAALKPFGNAALHRLVS